MFEVANVLGQNVCSRAGSTVSLRTPFCTGYFNRSLFLEILEFFVWGSGKKNVKILLFLLKTVRLHCPVQNVARSIQIVYYNRTSVNTAAVQKQNAYVLYVCIFFLPQGFFRGGVHLLLFGARMSDVLWICISKKVQASWWHSVEVPYLDSGCISTVRLC